MKELAYVLVADGTSDRALLPILRWALRRALPDAPLGRPLFAARRGRDVVTAVAQAREYAPDLIFVHRDAEGVPASERRREVPATAGVVPVIPVRMTEAWLLIDASALRNAAGNPHGRAQLDVPALKQLESLSDPKRTLKSLLADASALRGRHLARFDREARMQRVAELIDDYSALLKLPAFGLFWSELIVALRALGRQPVH